MYTAPASTQPPSRAPTLLTTPAYFSEFMPLQSQPRTAATEFVLLASGPSPETSISIAKFNDGSNAVEPANWQHPIFLTRENKDGKEVNVRRAPLDSDVPLAQRLEYQKMVQKNKRQLTWRIEDVQKANNFIGAVEGHGAGPYVLFKKEEGNVFRVIPVEEWFVFKRKSKLKALTIEEAEALMKATKPGEKMQTKSTKKEKEDREAAGDDVVLNDQGFSAFGDAVVSKSNFQELDNEEDDNKKKKKTRQ